MVTIKRTDSKDQDFRVLVSMLDQELLLVDGEEHSFYSQYNKLDLINHVLVLYKDDAFAACGALKQFDTYTVEVKRMFVVLNYRGNGFSSLILEELENWAREMNFTRAILETGLRQDIAISLYTNNNYIQFPNYGQYQGIENSVCYEKLLNLP